MSAEMPISDAPKAQYLETQMCDEMRREFLAHKPVRNPAHNHAATPAKTAIPRKSARAHARVATFVSRGEDRRAHHEKTVAGCEGGKCVDATLEAVS
jgi:hypothetical protein